MNKYFIHINSVLFLFLISFCGNLPIFATIQVDETVLSPNTYLPAIHGADYRAIFILNSTDNTTLTVDSSSKESLQREIGRQLDLQSVDPIKTKILESIDVGASMATKLVNNNQNGTVYESSALSVPIKCMVINGVTIWIIGGRGCLTC
jgi:hypothetical protein